MTTAVTSLSILNLISFAAMELLLAIPMGAQAIGSFSRIQSFLQLSDIPVSTTTPTNSSNDTDVSVALEKSMHRGPAPPLQHPHQSHQHEVTGDRSVTIPGLCFTPKSLIAITGPIGCGKSTVLRGLLSSNETQESCPFSSKGIAYCSQTPWIHEGTIRENIVGQSEFDNSWYQTVIRSCELDVDIGAMPGGHDTAVGSRGSKLSGGQKQRIVSSYLILGW